MTDNLVIGVRDLVDLVHLLDRWWAYRESAKLAPQRRSQRHMGGQVQQSHAGSAAGALYDQPSGADAGDAVMARWLQSAGLQHLASPMSSSDQRLLPSLLMQVMNVLSS